MKMTWRDSSTIILAFAAVFLSGYGIGHLVAERRLAPQASQRADNPPKWQKETLDSLQVSLQLRPDQMPLVENELSLTAKAITGSHDTAVLEYHQHLLRLYEKLIRSLDKQQAEKLRGEKKGLENKIRTMLSEES
jgi:hypothetical protein